MKNLSGGNESIPGGGICRFRIRLKARFTGTTLCAILLLATTTAPGKAAEIDPAAILEIGGATARSITDKNSSFGASVAVEVTPLEHWLELEAGVTSLFRRHASEWDTDLLFKKPWSLSRKVELMAGIGPEWVRARGGDAETNAFAVEAVIDFMFWPSSKRRFGWYLEPAYDYTFGHAHEKSIGVTAGLLIGIGKRR